jgi:hypothetical protein
MAQKPIQFQTVRYLSVQKQTENPRKAQLHTETTARQPVPLTYD